jgi:predicted DNA binding CopG/RHH family protein
MTEKKRKVKSRISNFESLEEEAEFWDTHDTADYEGEFKPVKVRFAKNFSEGITIRFDHETLEGLRARANKRGISPTALARIWIIERLKEDQPSRRQERRRR